MKYKPFVLLLVIFLGGCAELADIHAKNKEGLLGIKETRHSLI